jgi:hypothetical protein
MSKLSEHKLKKLQMRMDAAKSKPERPRIAEQLKLEEALLNAKKEESEPGRKLQQQMFGELSEKWKGNKGGSGGDAFVSGLKSGLQEGSFMEDKKRYKTMTDFIEKTRDMVAEQNIQLFKEEKLDNARRSVTPRIMAYLDSYKTMTPNDRKVFLQNAMEEYNKAADTDYKIVDATGSEPWKIIASDGEQTISIDLMDFIKTPEEKKLDYYLNSNESRNYESELQAEDELNKRVLESRINSHKRKNEGASPEEVQEKKKQLIESNEIPEGAILFDELDKNEKKFHMERIKTEADKGKAAKSGLKALDEMGKIFKKYPNISTSLAKWANSKGDTPFDNLIKSMVDQDQRNALIQLEKHAARLAIGTIEQFKGMRPTDILKKLIKETNPGSNFTYEAFIPIQEQYSQEFIEQVERSDEAERALIKRYVPTYQKRNNPNQPVVEIPAGSQASTPGLAAIKQERDAIVRELEELNRNS